ncbi:MAG: hypothetical protein PHG27_05795 [Massilibacteroides sp.]|nr:hypothetical protein [Massilibacteroides sp.]MDD4115097.1 hypothetical protein [Massilibacteroides sp.]
MNFKFLILLFLFLLTASCIDKDLFKGEDPKGGEYPGKTELSAYEAYLYPFGNEVQSPTFEITVETDGTMDLSPITAEIPSLKYNKTWLFLLTQDDCKHAAYSRMWAAINGKPVSDTMVIDDTTYGLFYDAAHLFLGDIPPGSYSLGKTLGSTDGAGNEVRFHFSTTLAPEWEWMHARTDVDKGFTDNYYRFFMKSGLIWDNVKEMINYGTGIAFHDVLTEAVNNADSILAHYRLSQDSILKNLNGRGCKFLAEPNGNKTYITAAKNYDLIQTITLQNGGVKLYPFQVKEDLTGMLVERYFYSPDENLKQKIQTLLTLPKEDRLAIAVGVHGTGREWVDFLTWLNDNYGKDGDDSVWFPNQEEYYEYNYYRIHGTVKTTIDKHVLNISVTLPSGKYFYYPSITLNLKGLAKEKIRTVKTNDIVTGLSYDNYVEGTMINVDCRKFLAEHAEHYVEVFEAKKTDSYLSDALYFVCQLKDSKKKESLLERLK